jgi:DNA-binding HxlR family transcriptional regulator
MLADNLDRIVAKLSKELVRALRDANRKELLALLPGLAKELSATTPAPRGRPPRTASAKPGPKPGSRPGPKPKSKGKAKAEPATPRKRGAGSLTRRITEIVRLRRDGLRFEEIQLRLKADPVELRETLGRMIENGRLEREGQARGTRYKMASSGDAARPAPARPPRPAPTPSAPVEVTDAMIDDLRLQLLNAGSPPNLPELQEKLPYTREQLKATLDRMRQEGLVERARGGPNPRYQLVSAPKKAPAATPPVVRHKVKEASPSEAPPEVAPEVTNG